MDKNLESIIEKVANNNSLATIKVKLAVEIFFKTQKHLMQRDDMPTIMIHGLGRFTPDERKLKRKLIRLRQAIEEGKITQEEFDKESSKFMEVLDRVQKTKHTRNN